MDRPTARIGSLVTDCCRHHAYVERAIPSYVPIAHFAAGGAAVVVSAAAAIGNAAIEARNARRERLIGAINQ